MTTAFTGILKGSMPVHKILENRRYLAFLESSPLAEGHTLVIPKKETDYLFDLKDRDLAGLMLFAKSVAKGLRLACPCEKVAVLVYGLKVRHAHVHLIPVRGAARELDFTRAKKAGGAELKRTAAKIRAALT